MGKVIEALKSDPTAQSLLIVNIIIICIAVLAGWHASMVLLIYWVQSVVIGFFTFIKLMTYKRKSKWGLFRNIHGGLFFSLHYGGFHVVYLLFIFLIFSFVINAKTPFVGLAEMFSIGFVFLVLVVFANHLFSFIQHRKEKVRKGFTKLIFEPYARIFPMHITLMFGVILVVAGLGVVVLVVFSLIKMYMDLYSHIQKHSKKTKLTKQSKRPPSYVTFSLSEFEKK